MNSEFQEEKCYNCEYCSKLSAGNNFNFLGCTFGKYKGKWTAELESCPLTETISKQKIIDIINNHIKTYEDYITNGTDYSDRDIDCKIDALMWLLDDIESEG